MGKGLRIMGQLTELVAEDDHRLGAWRADAAGSPLGRIVVVQEIFGVNSHIRAVCDRVAAQGFTALAPALFDRQQPGYESGYSPDEVAQSRSLMAGYNWDLGLKDVEAARRELAKEGPVAVIGFCAGGSIAWQASTQPGYRAAVCFYGGRVLKTADFANACPVQMHFGRQDQGIPVDQVGSFAAARADIEVHLYDAGHGFNCDQRAAYDEISARLAMERTITFLKAAFAAT